MLIFKCDAPDCKNVVEVQRGENPTDLANNYRNVVFVKKYSPNGKEAEEIEQFAICRDCSKRYDEITRSLFDLENWNDEK